MGNVMAMPNDWREFMQDFSFKDSEEVYTKGHFDTESEAIEAWNTRTGGADNAVD